MYLAQRKFLILVFILIFEVIQGHLFFTCSVYWRLQLFLLVSYIIYLIIFIQIVKGLSFVHLPAASDRSWVHFLLRLEIISKGSNGLHFLDNVLFMLDDFFKLDDLDLVIINFVGLEVIVKVQVSLCRCRNFSILCLDRSADSLSQLAFFLRCISLIRVLQFLTFLIIQSF